jgi:membrane protein Man1
MNFYNLRDPGDFRIEQAILEKCKNAKILHIGIDRSTREGCVYIRCLSKPDARNAYGSLHGWWFDGK